MQARWWLAIFPELIPALAHILLREFKANTERLRTLHLPWFSSGQENQADIPPEPVQALVLSPIVGRLVLLRRLLRCLPNSVYFDASRNNHPLEPAVLQVPASAYEDYEATMLTHLVQLCATEELSLIHI